MTLRLKRLWVAGGTTLLGRADLPRELVPEFLDAPGPVRSLISTGKLSVGTCTPQHRVLRAMRESGRRGFAVLRTVWKPCGTRGAECSAGQRSPTDVGLANPRPPPRAAPGQARDALGFPDSGPVGETGRRN